MKYYDWQIKVIKHQGDVTIRGGRQNGKSICVAERIVENAKEHPNSVSLITSPSERQENFLYDKVKAILERKMLLKKRPTLKEARLKNGSVIWKFPVGRTGAFVEGMSSVDFLYVDEAIRMSEESWSAILPMTAEPRKRGLGWITLLSNTRGKPTGFFRKSFDDPSFLHIHCSSEDCPHISKEFLAREKERIGERQYKMLWLGEFVDDGWLYFDKKVIEACMNVPTWHLQKDYNSQYRYFCGIDPARYGRNKAAFCVAQMKNKDHLLIVYNTQLERSSLIDLVNHAEKLHSLFNFSKFLIDSAGVGGGFYDFMEQKFKRKCVDLDNAKKSESGRPLKEDLYSNLLRLMETGKISFVYDANLKQKLEAVEVDEDDHIKGNDEVEALTRAAWCVKVSGYKVLLI